MRKKVQAVSPFSTGGGGVRFELLVAVHYLIKLLRQEVPRGMPDGVVQEVRFQQRNRGCPVDDVVVDCKGSIGHKRLYLQVKHSIRFSNNEQFIGVVEQAWKQVSSGDFNLDKDAVGLAIGEACNNATVRTHVRDILDWSRTSSTPRVFYGKVSKFSAKLRVLRAFQKSLRSVLDREPTQKQVQTLLRHFVVVSFDFATRSGRDTADCHSQLINSVDQQDTRYAGTLFTILYDMASEYAPQGGEITRESLSQRISANAAFAVPILQQAGRAIAEILSMRLHNRIAAQKNSKKYIPKVFVEVGDIKDRARLFCHPALFLRKIADNIAHLDLFELNRLMQNAGLKPLKVPVAPDTLRGTFNSLDHDGECLRQALEALTSSFSELKHGSKGVVARRVPRDKQHIFNEIDWRIGDIASGLMDFEVQRLLKDIDVASARVFAVVSRAGQGKTNFVCDLVENCLAKREIPCAFFTGKELGPVGRQQLGGFIARSIYGDNAPGTLGSLLKDLEDEASRRGTASIILIDAINEHPDLPVFSQEIEEFIEKCLKYPHVRVMLTCRSEYFDARFGNLSKSSFANRMIIEREIHERMGPEHRKRLIQGYFRFFRIRQPPMSEHVFKQLGEDPFLLRVFCEAYGDPAAKTDISIGRLRDIRREALFRQYFNRKVGALGSRAVTKTGFLVGTRHPYQELLRTIIEWMVQQKQFSDVPVEFLGANQLDCLSQVLDEDILVRRDLSTDSVLGTREVINFTFDACRDFLLADYLLNVVLQRNAAELQGLIRDLTHEQCTVAEGLRDYLFYASRHLQDSTATATIRSQPWYDAVFVDCVFDLHGSDVTREDADKLREICLSGDIRAPSIACNLVVNYDSALSPHANIPLLFEVLDAMTEARFDHLSERCFGAGHYGLGGGLYRIDKLAKDIRSVILPQGRKWHRPSVELVRLLLYLWDMEGAKYEHPARDLFHEFSKKHPRVADRLIREHVERGRKGYRRETPP